MFNTCMINTSPASEARQKDPAEPVPVQTSVRRLERPDSWGGQELVGMNSHDSAEIGSAVSCESCPVSSEALLGWICSVEEDTSHSTGTQQIFIFLSCSFFLSFHLAAVLVPSSH